MGNKIIDLQFESMSFGACKIYRPIEKIKNNMGSLNLSLPINTSKTNTLLKTYAIRSNNYIW
jgi:hypothetical protein